MMLDVVAAIYAERLAGGVVAYLLTRKCRSAVASFVGTTGVLEQRENTRT